MLPSTSPSAGTALDSIGLVDENQATTTRYSIPITLARLLGLDLDLVRAAALVLFAAAIAYLLLDLAWLRLDRAGAWASLALLLATGWLLPWYLIWVLPPAVISARRLPGPDPSPHRLPAGRPHAALSHGEQFGSRPAQTT